jgi:DNA-binding ferritin-like protein
MSSELREAVVNVGAQMHCRMQRRADLLRTAFDSMAEAAVKSLEPPKEMPKTWATWAIDPKLRPRGAPEDRRQLQRLLEQQRNLAGDARSTVRTVHL